MQAYYSCGEKLTELFCRLPLARLIFLSPNHRLSEGAARFYLACMLKGLAEMHQKGILHRDVKPGNCLIYSDGYLKLSDLGCAVQLDRSQLTNGAQQAAGSAGTVVMMSLCLLVCNGAFVPDHQVFSVIVLSVLIISLNNTCRCSHQNDDNGKDCRTIAATRSSSHPLRPTPCAGTVGTEQYVAPEVVAGRLYTARVDIFSAGASLYHMLNGSPPNLKGVYKGSVRTLRHVSLEANDLIRRLMDPVSSSRPTAAKALKHPWFAGFDWKAFARRSMNAPFVPKETPGLFYGSGTTPMAAGAVNGSRFE